MSNERWRRMWTLFHAAQAMAPGERAAFLAEACGGDEALRREVEALLEAGDPASDFLERPPLGSAGRDSEPDVPERIGPYRILGLVGEGGMGVVYEAEQEHPLRRRVALKLVKLGLDTREVVARFESERQALALMDHPNIAKVYDAGATEQGRPYFVMEYVAGVPITDYCDRHRLSVRERLELMIPVCRAIQHAHQKGIIHRDIKPSNVLVCLQDGKPVPKVIDFGVAKAIHQRLTERTLFTELGRMIGTPEYISPEQAEMSGLDVDTRTDIYSLGVLLYELLVGRRPFDSQALRSAPQGELQRILRESEPPRPSTRLARAACETPEIPKNRRADAASLRRQLRGDLDWIVMKAMEKDRTRRYATASELASDIERYLHHEPVSAGPPGAAYRLRKFVLRHKLAVAASLALALAVCLGVGGVVAGWIQARRAMAIARQEEEKAARISDFLRRMIAGVDPRVAKGRDTTLLREILANAARRLDTELKGQPLVAAALHQTLGETYANLGLYPQAERHARAAWELRRSALGEDDPETLRAIEVLAVNLESQGRFRESEELSRRILEARRRVLGEAHPETLRSMNNLAVVLKSLGRLDEAEALYRRALALAEGVLGEDDPSRWIWMSNLARLLEDRSELEEAERLVREVVEAQERTLGAAHPETLVSMDILAGILRSRGALGEAGQLHRQALASLERVLGETHPDTLGARYNLAIALMREGKLDEAEREFRRTLQGARVSLGARHRNVASVMHNLAECLHRRGKLEEARSMFEAAAAIARDVLPEDHGLHALIAYKRAGCLMDLGEFAEAERLLLQAYPRLEAAAGPAHPRTRAALERLIELYQRWDRPGEARRYEALRARAGSH